MAQKAPDKKAKAPSCWIITEGIAGTENQCLGVTDAMGLSPEVRRVALRFPWSLVSPWCRFGGLSGVSIKSGGAIAPPWPDLLIASGRKSVAVALHIREKSEGKTFTVQIQDPKIAPENFDLVVVPAHDSLRGQNVLVTTGALHRVTPALLADAREKFAGALSALAPPHLAVLIGGNSRTHKMTPAAVTRILGHLKTLSAGGASLMITLSRRTPPDLARTLKDGIAPLPQVFLWDGSQPGENPYFGFLAWADAILVTNDSVSMASEAISTGKPVYTLALDGGSPRFDRFHDLLQTKKHTRPFEGKIENWAVASPPRDTDHVAEEVFKRMATKSLTTKGFRAF